MQLVFFSINNVYTFIFSYLSCLLLFLSFLSKKNIAAFLSNLWKISILIELLLDISNKLFNFIGIYIYIKMINEVKLKIEFDDETNIDW